MFLLLLSSHFIAGKSGCAQVSCCCGSECHGSWSVTVGPCFSRVLCLVTRRPSPAGCFSSSQVFRACLSHVSTGFLSLLASPPMSASTRVVPQLAPPPTSPTMLLWPTTTSQSDMPRVLRLSLAPRRCYPCLIKCPGVLSSVIKCSCS